MGNKDRGGLTPKKCIKPLHALFGPLDRDQTEVNNDKIKRGTHHITLEIFFHLFVPHSPPLNPYQRAQKLHEGADAVFGR